MSDQLDLISEMGRDFATSMDIEGTLRLGLERIANTMNAEGGALFLLDEGAQNLVCHASYGPVDITGLSLEATEGIVGRTVESDVSEIVRDVSKDPNFDQSMDAESGFTTRSILCAPLSVKEQRLGAIEMVNKKGGDGLFTDDDLRLLATLASSAGLAILNARMAEELVEKEKMRRELELAGEIQRSLLPPPGEADFPVAGINLPARVVSGDFFDFFTLDDGRICFTLADVSGKGMNASLMMAKTASLFRCLGKERPYPGQLLARINVEINETAARGMFVTMLAGIYDPETGHIRFANAGHEPPLFFATDGTVTDYEATMVPVGILPDLAGGVLPQEEEVALDGGAFYIFTDGVTEGYIAEGVELGSDGFQKMIREGASEAPQVRIETIANRVKAVGPALRDDLTILVIDDGLAAAGRSKKPKPSAGEDVTGDAFARLSVGARAENLKLVRRLVEASATSCGFSKDMAHDVVLAVDEACQNVVRHAYKGRDDGEMIIEVGRDGSDFLVKIRDFAPSVDPDTIHPRDLDDIRPGGLGTHFIREIMDEVTFETPPEKEGNLLVLKKSLI